jgi:pyrroline-5-carboxylate reductase
MKIGFIGCGNMASAIISGMVKNNFDPSDIYISDINPETVKQRQKDFEVNANDNDWIAANCNLVFLAVKPQMASEVCASLNIAENIVISIMAGVTTKKLQALLNTNKIIRTMPNTPAMVGLGATGIYSLIGNNPVVEQIFNGVGVCVWVENEEQIDTITALSGSGPAYFYLMFEAMMDSAVKMGLSEQDAKKLCLQTAMGSAIMAKIGNVAELRENVTSKGGTTEAALNSFTQDGFGEMVDKAMTMAKNRADELSKDL